MKFGYKGVAFDMDKPEVKGWEFKEYRTVKYKEKYYEEDSISIIRDWDWRCTSRIPHWIATRKPVKPVVEGWAFLEDKIRRAKQDEFYYSANSNEVYRAIYDHESECWIVTHKREPKVRKVLRWIIKPSNDGRLRCYENDNSGNASNMLISSLVDNRDFIGFELEDGNILSNSIGYWDAEFKCYVDCVKQCDIESGKIEVRHATHAMFWE